MNKNFFIGIVIAEQDYLTTLAAFLFFPKEGEETLEEMESYLLNIPEKDMEYISKSEFNDFINGWKMKALMMGSDIIVDPEVMEVIW